jgi:predicted DNA-binding transcriptional regulator AlpA
MTSRAEVARILKREILDIHGVAEVTGMSRVSVNTLFNRPSAEFPRPIYETSGEQRHPVRLWYRKDVEQWQRERRRR